MPMKQVLIRQGRVVVEEMPVPVPGPGEVLVRAAYSLISAGTETASVQASTPTAPVSRWVNRFRKVGEVARMAVERGLTETRTAVEARLEGPSVLSGYSLAGTIESVGREITDLVPGQHVACAGAACAHHAEFVAVPRNLVAVVPEGLPSQRAAFVTLGSIAMHGVRQADPRLGEYVCVVGLGLLGQLTVALLRTAGCRVLGSDVRRDRVERAIGLGLERGFVVGQEDFVQGVQQATGGRGADAVILTAGTRSSEPIRQAVEALRRRGRVVVVGSVGMEIERQPFYMKEAELRIACSYGPGRYDPAYEVGGHDYPYEWVRWTENRNMQEFLRLAADGRVPVEGLIDRVLPVERADEGYAALSGDAEDTPLGVLLEYRGAAESQPTDAGRHTIPVVPRSSPDRGLGVALVGPGVFASNVHLPNLAALAPRAHLRAVVGRTGNAARECARSFAGAYATLDLDEALSDEQVDVVLIATRHDLHAEQAERALRAGKAVFLEKPAAITREGLAALETAVRETASPIVVGFNRRFARDVTALSGRLRQRGGPVVANYRVNAGRLPAGHWALGPQGGGRLIGEACHMLDLLGFLIGVPRTGADVRPLVPPGGRSDLPIADNLVVTLGYADGSIATLTYTSLGDPAAGKERIEVWWDGEAAVIDDFRSLEMWGAGARRDTAAQPDKGHREMLERFLAHAAGEGSSPIAWEEISDVTRLTLDLDDRLRGLSPGE
jgi:predicted dehydrogenase/threonine dehydrogenase-like Zn-dependent dehydrogenase